MEFMVRKNNITAFRLYQLDLANLDFDPDSGHPTWPLLPKDLQNLYKRVARQIHSRVGTSKKDRGKHILFLYVFTSLYFI